MGAFVEVTGEGRDRIKKISPKQYTSCRVPLAKRNAPQVGIFIAGNPLNGNA
jgi:hypothetical protein